MNALNGAEKVRKIQAVEIGDDCRVMVYEVGKALSTPALMPKAQYEPNDFEIIDGIKVVEIGEHHPRGPGDLWFYEVVLDNGQIVRVFNMTRVVLSAPMNIVPVHQRLVI